MWRQKQVGCVATVAAVLGGIAFSQPAESEVVATEGLYPKSESVVRAMGGFLDGLSQFSFTADIAYDRVLDSGRMAETHEVHQIAIKRPGRMRATVLGQEGLRVALISDGVATLIEPVNKKFYQCAVPDTLGEAVDVLVVDVGISLPSIDFVYQDSADSLLAGVTTSEYLGVVLLNGEPCHQMIFSQDGLEWQLWVSAGMHPTPSRIAMRYTGREGSPRFAASLEWDLDAVPYDDTAFQFVPDSTMVEVKTTEQFMLPGGE